MFRNVYKKLKLIIVVAMGPLDIKLNILIKTIEKMPDTFFTKDVSNHSYMISEHIEVAKHSHYHSFVGKALKILSNNQLYGKLSEIQKGTTKGSLWQKVSSEFTDVTEISNDQASKIIVKKSSSGRSKWLIAVFIIIVFIVVIIAAIIWLYFLALVFTTLFVIHLLRDSFKETRKGKN